MGLICVSLREPDGPRFIKALAGLEMAEIRMDGASLSPAEIDAVFSRPLPLIATFRPVPGVSPEARAEALVRAIRSGARFVDIERESPAEFRAELLRAAQRASCRIVVSHHDERETPDWIALSKIAEDCYAAGGEIAKIACRANTPADCARLLALYDRSRPIIALAMGPLGAFTRIVAPLLGAPWTYAARSAESATADGQLDWETTRERIRMLSGR